uniref:Hex14 n=1 Tax=Streptosporangium sp. FXJ7.131 TaxID=683272 RepID=A0A140DN25_9ACTN|nr:Hex14 [Streptosporangium sp. FXJ7.131]
MKVGEARSAAVQWVARYARPDAGFRGAYFSGSTVGLPDDAELPLSSDVDILVVTAEEDPPAKPGKLRFQGALLEVSYLPWSEIASPGDVLASYHLAGSFRTDAIIDDPTGHLRRLHAHVSPRFAALPWVRRRCQDARHRIETRLAAIDTSAPFHEQVASWLFPTGVTCHVLLVAALRNPTIRLRYLAAREVLTDYGHVSLYPEILSLLGCSHLPAQRVQRHLRELAATFDATVQVAKTPFFFSSDITPDARPIAIDGSQRLIDSGNHREAVFWIVATFARCHTILATDAPRLHEALTPAFRAAVTDLGISSTHDLLHRAEEVTRFLPRLWQTTENILISNPDITG